MLATVLSLLAPQALVDLPRPRTAEVVLFSSRDRSGGNEDWGHYLDVLPDGRAVLARATGPGAIRRIWTADPRGELEIRLDGVAVFAKAFAHLFDGSTAPFVAPLAGRSGGGCTSWVPLPFARECVVTLARAEPIHYQVDVARGAEWRGVDLALGAHEEEQDLATVVVEPDAEGTAAVELAGSGEACLIRARLKEGSRRDVRRQWLRVNSDGERAPCLSAPAALLFGQDPDGIDTRTLDTLATGGDGGWRELRLPMPFRAGMRIELAHAGALAVAWRRLPPEHGRLRLHGRFAFATTQRGAPFVPLDVVLDGAAGAAAEQRGRGHLVGLVLAAAGASGHGLSYLEGDERIVADGRDAVLGTGTEDFFSGAWYFRGGPFAHPFHAVAVVDGEAGRTLAARWLIADPVPFRRTLRVELEHGGCNDAPGAHYATVALFYADGAPGVEPEGVGGWIDAPPVPQPVWVPAAALWPADARAGGRVDVRADARAVPVVPWSSPARVTVVDAAGQRLARWLTDDATDIRVPVAVAGVARARIEPWLPAERRFRVAGPFAVAKPRQGVLETHPPEHDASPDAEYDVVGAGPRGWRDVETDDWTGYVDLAARMQPRDGVVAFAALDVLCEQPRRARAILGSDDSIQVHLNGRIVHTRIGRRGSVRDQDEVLLDLPRGTSTILLEIENWDGGFGFHFRLER